jgi:ribosomal-protein-alanine N-acetyltransferase
VLTTHLDENSYPEVVKYLTWGPNSEDETKKSLQKQIAFQTDKNRKTFVLAVVRNDTSQLIGNALLMIKDEDNKVAEIGYFLHPSHWNKGYGKEVVKGLLKLGFLELNMHRIYATCDVENIGSIKVLESLGFRLEGHFKQNLYVKGQWRDNYLFALLSSEYNENELTK